MSNTAQRKLAAILSADVKGYSRLMEEDEEGEDPLEGSNLFGKGDRGITPSRAEVIFQRG